MKKVKQKRTNYNCSYNELENNSLIEVILGVDDDFIGEKELNDLRKYLERNG